MPLKRAAHLFVCGQEEKLSAEADARKEKTAVAALAVEAEKEAKEEEWRAKEAEWRSERSKLKEAAKEVRDQLDEEKTARLQEVQKIKEGAGASLVSAHCQAPRLCEHTPVARTSLSITPLHLASPLPPCRPCSLSPMLLAPHSPCPLALAAGGEATAAKLAKVERDEAIDLRGKLAAKQAELGEVRRSCRDCDRNTDSSQPARLLIVAPPFSLASAFPRLQPPSFLYSLSTPSPYPLDALSTPSRCPLNLL